MHLHLTALTLLLLCTAAHAQEFNVDLGGGAGTPPSTYGGPYGQPGTWNPITTTGATSLVDTTGAPTAVDLTFVFIAGASSTSLANSSACATADAALVGDYAEAEGTRPGYTATFTNLTDGYYEVTLYAGTGSNRADRTNVNGVLVKDLVGACPPVEGDDWATVIAHVSGGTLTIEPSASDGSTSVELAGIQLHPIATDPSATHAFNIDIGQVKGSPSSAYGGLIGQPGVWSPVGTAFTGLLNRAGLPTPVTIAAAGGLALNGNFNCGPVGDEEALVEDFFFWSSSYGFTIAGLVDGAYAVTLYAPAHTGVTTGSLTVNGTAVGQLVGTCGTPVEGTDWATVGAAVTGGLLTISSGGAGAIGLAGIQIDPLSCGAPARSDLFGAGNVHGTHGRAWLATTQQPLLGGSAGLCLEYAGPPGETGVLMFGFDATDPVLMLDAVPIFVDLMQPHGVVPFVTAASNAWSFPVRPDLALCTGTAFHFQALIADSSMPSGVPGSLPVVGSNRLDWTIGDLPPLVITEVMQNPGNGVNDAEGEWFEIHNPTNAPFDLNGCTIRDDGTDTHLIAGAPMLMPGAYYVLGRNGDTGLNGGVTLDYVYAGTDLGNSGDELEIVHPTLGVLDRIAWDNGFTFPDPNGASMSLDPTLLNAGANDYGGHWCEASTAFGPQLATPGAANDACP